MSSSFLRKFFSLGFENERVKNRVGNASPTHYGNTRRAKRVGAPNGRAHLMRPLYILGGVVTLVCILYLSRESLFAFGRWVDTYATGRDMLVFLVVAVATLAVVYWLFRNVAYWRAHFRIVPLEIVSWSMIASGIFARQNVDLKTFSWSLTNFNVGALSLSALIALVVFPWVMRRVTKFGPQPGLEAVALPFAFGFMLDLARFAVSSWVPVIT